MTNRAKRGTLESALYCPTCGVLTEIVRRIMGDMYEIACENCDDAHVLMLHDEQVLPAHQTDEKQR